MKSIPSMDVLASSICKYDVSSTFLVSLDVKKRLVVKVLIAIENSQSIVKVTDAVVQHF